MEHRDAWNAFSNTPTNLRGVESFFLLMKSRSGIRGLDHRESI